jgi:hypothetical protein
MNSPVLVSDEPGGRTVYCVVFFFAPFPERPRHRLFLFSSLAAIFDLFSSEQVGCSLGNLYNLKVPDGVVYQGTRCSIYREKVFSKRQKRG